MRWILSLMALGLLCVSVGCNAGVKELGPAAEDKTIAPDAAEIEAEMKKSMEQMPPEMRKMMEQQGFGGNKMIEKQKEALNDKGTQGGGAGGAGS